MEIESFAELTKENNSYYINLPKRFMPTIDINEYVEESVNWALSQKYFKANGRSLSQIMGNAILGKMGEFALYKHFTKLKLPVTYPDLKIRDKGEWDDGDLFLAGNKLQIKTTHHKSNILLLKKDDWSINGEYKWKQDDGDKKPYNAFFLCRIRPKITDVLYIENEEIPDKDRIMDDFMQVNFQADFPGFITIVDFRKIIDSKIYLKKGDLLYGKKKLTEDSYYCQTGNLRPIDSIENKRNAVQNKL